MKKVNDELMLTCKIYENKLKEILSPEDFSKLGHEIFRMLQIQSIDNAEGDFKNFLRGIVEPSEEEMKNICLLE